MPEHLTLVTRRSAFMITSVRPEGMYLSGTVRCRRVVGVTPPGEATMLEHRYRLCGDEGEEELRLAAGVTQRIAEFFRQTKARPESERPLHSCHAFARFVTGATATIAVEHWAARPYAKHVHRLDAGAHYLIENQDGEYCHSVIGIDNPNENLSITGRNAPLVITENRLLVPAYRGIAMLLLPPPPELN